jgi:phosphoglycolate phosphatase
MSKYKLLAFDVDGTLFSSEGIILQTYIEAIENYKTKFNSDIKIPSKEKIIEQVGLPVKKIFQNLLPEISEQHRDLISDDVLVFLTKSISEKKGHIYDSVIETIKILKEKGYLLGAASNGRFKYIDTILKTYTIDSYFEKLVVINYEDIKEKGDILKKYSIQYNLLADEILMIGDRDSDYKAAKDINCDFVFCEYGHASPNEIQEYTYKINSFKDLLNFL